MKVFNNVPSFSLGSNYYFYHNDHLGTPQQLSGTSGAVVWAAAYSAFGEAHVNTAATLNNNLRFPGQYLDEETGLHYNYFRNFDPIVGRYLSPDPIGVMELEYITGTPTERRKINHLYNYLDQNPIVAIDPYGLARFKELPLSGCGYYKELCEKKKYSKCPDEYSCKAYNCCLAFGESPKMNCVRGCLIAFDKRNCAHLCGEERNRCRRIAHWDCYDRCLIWLTGAKTLLFGTLQECIDAMNEVGGLGM